MQASPRSPVVSVAALAAYLVVHVIAGVLHHHVAESLPGKAATSCIKDLQFQTISAHENDEDETCLLCNVLHLAQILPTAFQIEAVALLSSEELSAAAIIRPHPLETATFTRGPPLI
jgi:hypothetical protein